VYNCCNVGRCRRRWPLASGEVLCRPRVRRDLLIGMIALIVTRGVDLAVLVQDWPTLGIGLGMILQRIVR
jgi:hypothetical protein